MANRDATVRLNLAAAGFASQMRELMKRSQEFADAVEEIGGASEQAKPKASGLFSALKTAAGGAKSALGELGGQLKSVLSTALTLGGALSIGGAIREAEANARAYKDLAFAISVGTGEAIKAEQVQANVEGVASRWKVRVGEVRAAYAGLFQETGNLKFTQAATETVAKAHVATGKSVETLTSIVGLLNDKFGITEEGIDNATAAAIELGNKGGISLEDMGAQLGELGAVAKTAGLSGQDGFQKMVGLLNIADGPMKNMRQSLAGMKMLFEGLVDPDRAKQFEKALGVKVTDPGGALKGDALERILAKTRGKQSELAKVFTGQELRLVSDLGKTFAKTFEETKGDVQTKTAAALDAYRKSVADAAKVGFTGADLDKAAAARQNDANRNLDQAMNDFVKSFERPEVIEAIDKVAAAAPKLAQALGSLVEFAAKSPILAGAGLLGGVAAKGAAGAIVTKVSDKAMERAGDVLGASLAKPGKWTAMGTLAGASFVAAAAASGWQIGKAIADYLLESDESKRQAGLDAASTAESMAKHGTGTPEERKAAADALRAQIAEKEKEGGPGLYTRFAGSVANLVDPSVERAETTYAKDLAQMKAQLEALEGPAKTRPVSFFDDGTGFDPDHPFGVPAAGPPRPPSAGGPSADAERIAKEVAGGGAAGEPRKMALTNEQALAAAIARQLGNTPLRVVVTGGGGGTNGMPGAPGNGSGSTPL